MQHGKFSVNLSDYQGHRTKYSLEIEIIWTTHGTDLSSRGPGEFVTECTISTQIECTCNFHSGNTVSSLFYEGCECIGSVQRQTCQTVFFPGGSSGSGGVVGVGDSSCNTTSGTVIRYEQPLEGIQAGCTPNNNNFLLPPDLDITCTANQFVTDYVYSCLGITAFTQQAEHFYITNPSNACEVGKMAIFLQQNSCDQVSENFAFLALEALLEGGDVDFVDQVIVTASFKNNQKTNCVLNKLKA